MKGTVKGRGGDRRCCHGVLLLLGVVWARASVRADGRAAQRFAPR